MRVRAPGNEPARWHRPIDRIPANEAAICGADLDALEAAALQADPREPSGQGATVSPPASRHAVIPPSTS